MDVTGTKGPQALTPERLGQWARNQILIARTILDNPGGGLVFATQAIGQVTAALAETEDERWLPAVRELREAEFHAVRRGFVEAQQRLAAAVAELDKL